MTPFVCPECRAVSREYHDMREGYCPACIAYTDLGISARRVSLFPGVPKNGLPKQAPRAG